ncbi:MAG: MarR family transcriptional regulator [Oscillospiraceae bacterium]|nr:MarR family transcriptional regulator [Oscillospiraceae bacterium]
MNHPFHGDNSLPSRFMGSFFRFGHIPWYLINPTELSHSEMGILLTIHHSEHHGQPLRISDLSKFFHVSSPTMTQHINGLEARGYVKKTQVTEDKRAINLALTEKGQAVLDCHHSYMKQKFSELSELLGERDTELFISIIEKSNEFFKQKQNENGENFLDRR